MYRVLDRAQASNFAILLNAEESFEIIMYPQKPFRNFSK